jgi:hypothetical protein
MWEEGDNLTRKTRSMEEKMPSSLLILLKSSLWAKYERQRKLHISFIFSIIIFLNLKIFQMKKLKQWDCCEKGKEL